MPTQTARETPATATNGRPAQLPELGDALRKVLNALETLRIVAQDAGDYQALLCAEVCQDVILPTRGIGH